METLEETKTDVEVTPGIIIINGIKNYERVKKYLESQKNLMTFTPYMGTSLYHLKGEAGWGDKKRISVKMESSYDGKIEIDIPDGPEFREIKRGLITLLKKEGAI